MADKPQPDNNMAVSSILKASWDWMILPTLRDIQGIVSSSLLEDRNVLVGM